VETTIPAEYAAVLAGAIAVYGSCSFILTQILRRLFTIEGKVALLVSGLVAAGMGVWAAVQVGLTTLPGLTHEHQIFAVIGLVGGAWWASQEIYRRLRADTWATRGDPCPSTK